MVLKHVYFSLPKLGTGRGKNSKGKHEIAKAKRKGDNFDQVLSSLFKRYEVFSFQINYGSASMWKGFVTP